MTGKTLGHYTVLEPLGAGGMGEVYRARDTRLGREVAVKILPPEAVRDPDRQRRFEHEARAIAALNHPNILTVHDVGTEDGVPYLVTELVDGQPLRALLAGGPVPVRRLLDLAVQVADGMAAAHEAGITHRDLKPENVMVTRDDRVKILDFGLAKAIAPETDDARTATEFLTEPGRILGTVAYMSPEQARGGRADFRSDQFSLGLILYEMAAGRRPFQRDSPAQTMSAIIQDDPAPLAGTASPALRWLIERCLAKEPRQRYGATIDLYHELRSLREHLSEMAIGPVAAPAARKRRPAVVLAAVGVVVGLLLAAVLLPTQETDLSSQRLTPLATEAGLEGFASWSPDGKSIAYAAEVNGVFQIFTRSLGSAMASQITQSPVDCLQPFWHPDGTRLFYLAGPGGNAKLAAVGAGGLPRWCWKTSRKRRFRRTARPWPYSARIATPGSGLYGSPRPPARSRNPTRRCRFLSPSRSVAVSSSPRTAPPSASARG